MNLLIWLSMLWLMGLLGQWLWEVAPFLGLFYAVCVTAGLGSYWYTHGVVYIFRKLRQVDALRARGEKPDMWTAWRIAHVSLFGLRCSLYTTMYGLPGWRHVRGSRSQGKHIGIETRYFTIYVGRE